LSFGDGGGKPPLAIGADALDGEKAVASHRTPKEEVEWVGRGSRIDYVAAARRVVSSRQVLVCDRVGKAART
jgi:hypothetical protein